MRFWTEKSIEAQSVVCQIRAGRVRELTRSSRSKFKIVSYQFSTVQFPSLHFDWKARSVQFGAP